MVCIRKRSYLCTNDIVNCTPYGNDIASNQNYRQLNKKETFATRLGGVMAAVGAAVGLGNIWRFPCETGEHGGAAFLLIYLICVIGFGTPLMLAELSLGRMTRSNPAQAFHLLFPNRRWIGRSMGLLCSTTVLMVLGFYGVVAGWTLKYTTLALVGNSAQQDFGAFIGSTWEPMGWLTLLIALNAVILLAGVRKGIERASRLLMPLLGVLMVVLLIRSLTLPGALEGLKFLFEPDFSKITGQVVISAMGQSFFTISMGAGCLLVYGSYLPDDTPMMRMSLTVTLLDTLVAIMAGIIIFPACFSYGIAPSAGPGLAFITLPQIFVQMPLGYVWALVFFLLLAVAALTSSISMFEVPIATLSEQLGISRRRAVVYASLIAEVLAVGCCLSFSSDLGEALTWGDKSLFDWFDYITATLLLPIGGIVISLCVGWVVKEQDLRDLLHVDSPVKEVLFKVCLWIIRIVAPVCIPLCIVFQ